MRYPRHLAAALLAFALPLGCNNTPDGPTNSCGGSTTGTTGTTSTTSQPDDPGLPIDIAQWAPFAEIVEVQKHLGRESLHVVNGFAVLSGMQLANGTISFDIAARAEVGFMGVTFHQQDPQNFETFYLRTHHSNQPDANQYQPYWNGHECWQLYYGTEYSVQTAYPNDDWIHVKMVISGNQAEVYLDSDSPSLIIPERKGPWTDGGVGLWAFGTDAWFSNIVVEPASTPPKLSGGEVKREEPAPGTIKTWRISEMIDEETLGTTLDDATLKSLSWSDHAVEYDGILNLAAMGPIEKDAAGTAVGPNTVLAKIDVTSSQAQVKELRIGFSDRARVYVNGKLVWYGSDSWQTRDYRFLGTVGLWDTVYAWLGQGENQIVVAVSETEGGWGLVGALPDQTGLALSP